MGKSSWFQWGEILHNVIILVLDNAYRITFAYRQAEDYPVDLYFLMDLSKTMEVHKNKLSSLGETLANTMGKITRNFRLGFGSFIDKVIMPFGDKKM